MKTDAGVRPRSSLEKGRERIHSWGLCKDSPVDTLPSNLQLLKIAAIKVCCLKPLSLLQWAQETHKDDETQGG